MTMKILFSCISVMPIVLFITGSLGVFGVMTVGPREMLKKHPYNQKMSLALILSGLGLFAAIQVDSLLSTIGVLVAISGVIIFSFFYHQARKLYPMKSDQEWIAEARKQQTERMATLRRKKEEKKNIK